ncbi:MerR family transcriptional regulator [Paenibacillus kandeliae]|uniref:MerR family transcriptional regulator n=1 Tax=Paenibacillus kandeliae TaxID=3231269 RepID=UPI00345A0122
MKQQWFTVHDIVQITSISRRTLHFYDSIDLLKPSKLADNGYRRYDRDALTRLQTILMLKDMQFSLKDIASILQLPAAEQQHMLIQQRQLLEQHKQQLERTIQQLDQRLAGTPWSELQRSPDTSVKSLQDQYAAEAALTYGNTTAYKQFQEQQSALSPAQQQEQNEYVAQQMDALYKQLADHMHALPQSPVIQNLIEQWAALLATQMPCEPELLRCIADTYIEDARFVDYFESYGTDFARFLHAAITDWMQHVQTD